MEDKEAIANTQLEISNRQYFNIWYTGIVMNLSLDDVKLDLGSLGYF